MDGINAIIQDEADQKRARRVKKYRTIGSYDPYTFSILDHGEGLSIINGSSPTYQPYNKNFPRIVEMDEF